MSAKFRWWLQWPTGKRFGLFAAAIISFVGLCLLLPPEAWDVEWRVTRRTRIALPAAVLISWAIGWFVVTFVRVQDPNIIAPVDVQTPLRLAAAGVILISGIAGALLMGHFLFA